MRIRKLLAGGFLLFLVGVLFPFPLGRDNLFVQRLFDLVHVPLFAGLYFGVYLALRIRMGFLAGAVLAVIASSLSAIAVEFIQPHFGRSASEQDALYGVLGACFACSLHLALIRLSSGVATAILMALGLGIGPIVLTPAVSTWKAVRWNDAAFPRLGDFDNPYESVLWRPSGHPQDQPPVKTKNWASTGTQSLVLSTSYDGYSGVEYRAGTRSWAEYSTLAFDVYALEGNWELYVRIDDDGDCRLFDSRINRSFLLHEGKNEIRLKIDDLKNALPGRVFNMERIRRLIIFAGPSPNRRTFYLDNIRLEPHAAFP